MSLTAGQPLLSFRMYFHPKHTQISRSSSLVNLSLASHPALLLGKDKLWWPSASHRPALSAASSCAAAFGPSPCCAGQRRGWEGDFSLGKGMPAVESSYGQREGVTATQDYQMKWSLHFKATNSSCKQLKPQRSDASKNLCIYQSHFKLLSELKDLIAV